MKKGFWNYTEPVTYRVVLVKLLAVDQPRMHWQNALAGEERQAVEITQHAEQGDCGNYVFLIDNGDGSGLLKLEAGGGPGSMHRSVQNFELIGEVTETEWQQWDPQLCKLTDLRVEAWQAENYPEDFAKLKALQASWANSDTKKFLDKQRQKNKSLS